MFQSLSPMVGEDGAASWNEVDEDDSWDFRVEQPVGGSVAYFAYTDAYKETLASRDLACKLSSLTDALNNTYGEEELPFVVAQGSGDYALADAGGDAIPYEANETLKELARLASTYKASQGEEPAGMKLDSDAVLIDGAESTRGEVLLYFPVEVPEKRIKEIAREQGCEVKEIWESFDDEIRGVIVKVPDGKEKKMISIFEDYSEVAHSQRSPHFHVDDVSSTTSDIAARSIDSSQQYYLEMSGFTTAWKTVKCEGKVAIGVIDTGVDWENTEIKDNIDAGRMKNASTGDVGTNADMRDRVKKDGKIVTHGTHVISVASAITGDVTGCDGASYNAKVIPVKMTDSNDEINRKAILKGYKYLINLDDPPEVINLSFSSHYPSKKEALSDTYVIEFQKLVNQAWDKGIVTVASAGNDGYGFAKGDIDPNYDDDGEEVIANGYNYPACLKHVVSVGALAKPTMFDDDSYIPHLASFSNTTSSVDIAAYGVGIHVPNAYHDSSLDVADWFKDVNGTSFSAPQVASAAALVKAKNPNYSASKIVKALKKTASKVEEADASNPRSGYGTGVLDAAASVKWSSPSSSPETGGSAIDMYLRLLEGGISSTR